MRNALLTACPLLVWVITAAEAVLLLLALRGWARKKEPLYLLTALVTLGLCYDALILSLGTVLPGGPLLAALSRMRYVAHGALIPLLFPICAYALGLSKLWKKLVWVLTAVLIAAGIAEGFATALELREVAGLVRYASGDATPAWASAVSGVLSYGAVVPLILAGIVVWVKQKTPLLFLSGFLMFAFSALGPATGNFDLIFFISMFGEVCMALCFLLYAQKSGKSSS